MKNSLKKKEIEKVILMCEVFETPYYWRFKNGQRAPRSPHSLFNDKELKEFHNKTLPEMSLRSYGSKKSRFKQNEDVLFQGGWVYGKKPAKTWASNVFEVAENSVTLEETDSGAVLDM